MTPALWVLSFSGGTGSTCLAELILSGALSYEPLVVLNANPGMEDHRTYTIVENYRKRFQAAGTPFVTVRRNLYQEILELKAKRLKRFDLPPYWTRNRETGQRGRLKQGCTQVYKIAEMDRALRVLLEEHFGVSRYSRRIGDGFVGKLIGFSHDEWHRIKEARQKYVQFHYPLVETLKWDRAAITRYFLKNNIPIPPRSVCNACYANDVAHFKAMHAERPADWAQAVAVDNEIRDLTCLGIRDECFVSSTLLPLEELARRNFELSPEVVEQDAEACHSGHCFV